MTFRIKILFITKIYKLNFFFLNIVYCSSIELAQSYSFDYNKTLTQTCKLKFRLHVLLNNLFYQ